MLLFFSALLLSHRADAAVIIQRPLYIGLTSGLVGYWSFDGQDTFGKVNKTIDGSGNNNHGTLTNGATTTIGKLGQALSFDGVDDYVAITENAGLAMSQGTLAAWVKLPSSSDNDENVFGASSGAEVNNSIELGTNASANCTNELITLFRAGFSNHLCYTSANRNELFDNNWHHIVVMVDGTGATRIYLDGISRTVTVGAGSDTGDFIAAGADRFRIGDLNDTSSEVNFLGGQIDDVRIYNRALSKEEIKRLYTMGRMNH